MTYEYREWLKSQIDQARRQRVGRVRTEDRKPGPRSEYWRKYHLANRERRLARTRERRAA